MRRSHATWALAALLLIVLGSVCLAEAYREFKEVDKVSSPIYRQRHAAAWKAHSRLVGQIFNAPERFTIELYKGAEEKPFKVEELYAGALTVYETGWLIPGTYKLCIKAPGFDKFTLKKIELKAGTDCILDITFGKHEFKAKVG